MASSSSRSAVAGGKAPVSIQRMPAALSARLGHDAAAALEDVLEAREVLVIQTLQKEMQELRTELRLGMQELRGEMQALRSDLKASMADTRADLMKWSLLFWVGQVAVVLALARVFGAMAGW